MLKKCKSFALRHHHHHLKWSPVHAIAVGLLSQSGNVRAPHGRLWMDLQPTPDVPSLLSPRKLPTHAKTAPIVTHLKICYNLCQVELHFLHSFSQSYVLAFLLKLTPLFSRLYIASNPIPTSSKAPYPSNLECVHV